MSEVKALSYQNVLALMEKARAKAREAHVLAVEAFTSRTVGSINDLLEEKARKLQSIDAYEVNDFLPTAGLERAVRLEVIAAVCTQFRDAGWRVFMGDVCDDSEDTNVDNEHWTIAPPVPAST